MWISSLEKAELFVNRMQPEFYPSESSEPIRPTPLMIPEWVRQVKSFGFGNISRCTRRVQGSLVKSIFRKLSDDPVFLVSKLVPWSPFAEIEVLPFLMIHNIFEFESNLFETELNSCCGKQYLGSI